MFRLNNTVKKKKKSTLLTIISGIVNGQSLVLVPKYSTQVEIKGLKGI